MAAQMLFKSACTIVFSLRRVARYGLQFCEYLILRVSHDVSPRPAGSASGVVRSFDYGED